MRRVMPRVVRRSARKRITGVEIGAIMIATSISSSGGSGAVMMSGDVAVATTGIPMKLGIRGGIERRLRFSTSTTTDVEEAAAASTKTSPPVVKQLRRARHASAIQSSTNRN